MLNRHHFGASYGRGRAGSGGFGAPPRRSRSTPSGFDRVFRRTWDLSLAYSETGSCSGYLDVAQMVFTRNGGR